MRSVMRLSSRRGNAFDPGVSGTQTGLPPADDIAGCTVVTHPICCYCQGEGVVSAEVQR
jgi:hypothetical protein